MRRGDKEIHERDEINRILDDAQVVRLGMIDGHEPYVVPLNFAREGDDLWIHCAADGRKLECLRVSPAVCAEVDKLIRVNTGTSACHHFSTDYESVMAFGRAEIVQDDETRIHGLQRLMHKYSARDEWEFDQAKLESTTVLRVRLETFSGKRAPA